MIKDDRADARLSAAAPELLEAAERLIERVNNPYTPFGTFLDAEMDALEIAVSKARGQA